MREKERGRCFCKKKSKRPFACRFPGSGLGLGVVLAPRERRLPRDATRTRGQRRGGAASRGPPGREAARVAVAAPGGGGDILLPGPLLFPLGPGHGLPGRDACMTGGSRTSRRVRGSVARAGGEPTPRNALCAERRVKHGPTWRGG